MKTSALLAMETFFALSESSAAVACGPRLGTLLSGFPTPATLTETRGGQLVHLTPEQGRALGPSVVAVRFGEVHTQAGPVAALDTTLSSYLHLGRPAIVTARVPGLAPAAQTSDKGHGFETFAGRRVITPKDYSSAVATLRPSAASALADEVPASMGQKRQRKAVARSLEWLDVCVSACSPAGIPVLATVVGGLAPELRAESAAESAKRDVQGFWLGGLGLGESYPDRMHTVSAVCGALPVSKPRFACTAGHPVEVLDLISRGVDVIDGSYPSLLTQFNYAATFRVSEEEGPAPEGVFPGGDGTKMCARSSVFVTDARPLVPGCGCYTCATHSRAYVLHLLNVHEMLGPSLLQIHNTYHYGRLFENVRGAIAAGRFAEYTAWFLSTNGLEGADTDAHALVPPEGEKEAAAKADDE